jgi:hypothetical protein
MDLEEIEGIRADIKELKDAREINVREATNSISNIQLRYDALVRKKGEDYCIKNCPEIPGQINILLKELEVYKI